MRSHFPALLSFAWIACSLLLVTRSASACDDDTSNAPCADTDHAREAWMEDRFDASLRTGGTGARLSMTRVHGSDDDRTGSGLGLSIFGHEERYGLRGMFTMRNASFAFLGGGSQGLEGGLGGDGAGGVLLPVAKNQGPFFRFGARGYLFGNGAYYTSLLEIPQLQVGYGAMGKGTLLELAARGGPILIGRFNTGVDAHRKLGRTFEVGGLAAIHASPAHVEVEHTHILPEGGLGAVDLFSARLCGSAWVLHVCTDVRYGRGESNVPEGSRALDRPVEAYYAGLLLGTREGAFEDQKKKQDKRRHHEPPPKTMVRAGE